MTFIDAQWHADPEPHKMAALVGSSMSVCPQSQFKPLPEPYSRYLRVLGFDEVPQGLAGLHELVRRHLCRVPFENISKLLLIGREGIARIPDLDEFLAGIEFRDLGGTCYTNNPFLHRLLRALGYEADLLGADMQNPNVHTVIRVRIGETAYHVDVGYAAPLRRPIAFDEMPVAIDEGELRYELSRNENGCEMRVLKDGQWVHGYRTHDTPRNHAFFGRTILDSYLPQQTFMTTLRITRFFEEHSVELRDDMLTVRQGTMQTQRNLRSRAELRAAVNSELELPRCPVEDALEVLERATGKRMFMR